MKLKLFIEKFVCKNTLIRLWFKHEKGYIMVTDESDKDKLHSGVCMEWEILRGVVWQSKYANCKVIGVTDILVDSFYKEAVNIVIEKPSPCFKEACIYYDKEINECLRLGTTGKVGTCWLEESEGEMEELEGEY